MTAVMSMREEDREEGSSCSSDSQLTLSNLTYEVDTDTCLHEESTTYNDYMSCLRFHQWNSQDLNPSVI